MITIFNGRQLSLDGTEDVVYAQVSVALRDKIHLFNTGRNCNPFAVFMALALHADRDGWAWPGREKLSQETGIKNAIGNSIKHLRKMRIDGHKVLCVWRERRTDGQWARTLYRIFPDAWQDSFDWPEKFNPQGEMGIWDPIDKDDAQPYPHKAPMDKPPLDYVPPKDPHVLELDPVLKEKEPPLADSPSALRFDELPIPRESGANDSITEDVAETEAMFKAPNPPPEHRTAAECKAGIARAVVAFEENGGGRAGVADPTLDTDPWADIVVREWCGIAKKDYGQMPTPARLKLAGIFRKVGAIAKSGAVPVAAAIQRFPKEHEWWAEKVGFEWPSESFCNKLGMMLVPDIQPEPPPKFDLVEPDWLGVTL